MFVPPRSIQSISFNAVFQNTLFVVNAGKPSLRLPFLPVVTAHHARVSRTAFCASSRFSAWS